MELEKLKKFALISIVFSIGTAAVINVLYSTSIMNTIKIAVLLALTFFVFGLVFSILAGTIKKCTKNLK